MKKLYRSYFIIILMIFISSMPEFAFAEQINPENSEKTSGLLLLLQSTNPRLREKAVEALGDTAYSYAEGITGLINEIASLDYKKSAQKVYEEKGKKYESFNASITALLTISGDINAKVRASAVDALGNFGTELDKILTSVDLFSEHNLISASMIEKLFSQKKRIYKGIEKLHSDYNLNVSTESQKVIKSLKLIRYTGFSKIKPWAKEPDNELTGQIPEKIKNKSNNEPVKNDDFYIFDTGSDADTSLYSFQGFLETENYIPYYYDFKSGSDQVEMTDGKSEFHLKLDFKFGSEEYFIKAITHSYLYIPGDKITHTWYENRIQVPEIYLSVVRPSFDVQVGKQIIKWGTADAVNPTSYFSPYDLTENLLKDDDVLYQGVTAMSCKYLFGDYALQTVIAPFHNPAKLPENDSPWALSFPDTMGFPVSFQDSTDDIYTSAEHTGVALRFTGTGRGADFSFSCYHGPDKDIALVPQFNSDNTAIEMVPYYSVVNSVGADFAYPLGNFTLQGEAVFTKDKPAVPDPSKTGLFPVEVEKKPFVYWTGGFTWLTESDYTIIIEYLDGFYTKGNNYYYKAFFSELLSASIKKKYFNEKLYVELKGMYNTENKDSVCMPSAEWSFKDNFKMVLFLNIFSGEPDTLFGSYDQHDNGGFKLKYYF